MAAYLIFRTGAGSERVPCGNGVTIGRDKSNQIVLSDLMVSRHHAMVRLLGEQDYYFIDSGSSNGSRINDRRITTPTLLCNGDRITVGDVELRFEQEPAMSRPAESVSHQATMVVHRPLIQEITILVADIRGFTALSEQLPIQTLTRVMNQWFNRVGTAIGEHRGIVDKFIGDCVFARWESDDSTQDVIDALHTACLINRITAGLTSEFPELREPLRIGAGIHTGVASLGIGSENTVLGDSVNTAFRLESASKELGVDILLSQSALSHLPGREWGSAQRTLRLKGKAKPVQVVGLDLAQAETLFAELQRCRQ